MGCFGQLFCGVFVFRFLKLLLSTGISTAVLQIKMFLFDFIQKAGVPFKW